MTIPWEGTDSKLYIGIDVGGTNLRAGLVNEKGDIMAAESIPLGIFQGEEAFAAQLATLSRHVMEKAKVAADEVEYVGIGIPGAVAEGKILYTCNIPMKNVLLEQLFRAHLDLPVLLENDANCAAVGEYFCGAGRGTRNFIVVTLGTGIGGGIILGGKLYTGMGSAGEIGHMVIQAGGRTCSCGRSGCWETYASATGLIHMTREAMEHHPESLMNAAGNRIDGRTAFDAALQNDEAARKVCETYVSHLSTGLVNLINVLQPEAIALGGGVAGAPDQLLLWPLRKIVEAQCYGAHTGKLTKIVKAQMGNDAGVVGAALLRRAI
jgi:glucokinase